MKDYEIPEDVQQSFFQLGNAPHCGRQRQISSRRLFVYLAMDFKTHDS